MKKRSSSRASNPPNSPSRASRGQETRAALIEAAFRLFERDGFHRVGLPALGQELGISHAAIYAYFRDKEEILEECCRIAIERIRAIVDGAIDPNAPSPARLRAYLDGNLEWVLKRRELAGSLLTLYYFGAHSPRLRALHLEMDQGSIERLETHVILGNQSGAWKVASTRARASAIHSLIVGEMIKAFHFPKELSRPKRLEALWRAVEALLK